MKKIIKYTIIYTIGGLLYGLTELLFRGHTHWSMLVAGGVCFVFLYLITTKSRDAAWKKCVMGGAVITTVEFVTGGIVNLGLGWNVWDYSGHPLNLLGQICLLFTFLWMLLSLPAMWLCRFLDNRIFRRLGMRASGKRQV